MSLLYKLYYTIIVFTKKTISTLLLSSSENSNPQANRPREMQASRRNLHFSSPSHIHLPSSVITRVSRLMVATQYVKGKHNSIYAGCKETTVLLQKAPYT
jgi:hypothetical protein